MISVSYARKIVKQNDNYKTNEHNYNVDFWFKRFQERINRKITNHYSFGNGSNSPVEFSISDLGFIQTDNKFELLLNDVLNKIKEEYTKLGWTIHLNISVSKINNLKTIDIKLEEQCGI